MATLARKFSPLLATLLTVLAIILLIAPVHADEAYCSSQNTAPDNTYYNWKYQSNGNCTNHCNQEAPGVAFAVLQYQDCWCSNYIPGSQTDKSRCGVSCPGFPAENCGSKDDGLYLYLSIGGKASGTAGSPKPTSSAIVSSAVPPSSSSKTPTPAPTSSSVAQTPSSAPPDTVSSVFFPDTTAFTKTAVDRPSFDFSTSSSFSLASTVFSPKPSSTQASTSLLVITESGAVVTKTIVQTPNDQATSSAAPVRTGNGDGGPNIGAIVGGVLGGVLGLLAIAGGVLFFLWRRRKQQQRMHDEMSGAGIGGGSTGITRNTSTMSSAGLLGRGSGSNSATQYPPAIATNFGTANSRFGDQDSISPVSNRRNSQPMMIDSRLDPKAMLTFANSNASRDSLASMDDSRDYGRQLNVRNPDP